MSGRLLFAILKKDVLSLLPIVVAVALLFLCDALIGRLDLLPVWTNYSVPVLLAALVSLILLVFQLDSPASLTDDWLCRPVQRRELLGAKLLLVTACVYLPRAVGTFAADSGLGLPLTESLLDAFLLQDPLFVFLTPILLFTAIVTRTLVQGLGVLFAIFIGVFVLPTPFLRPPGPLSPGIRDSLLDTGMNWLATTPALLASCSLLALGIWLVYWRRRLAAARVLMGIAVVGTLLFLVLPMALLPWSSTFAIQNAFSPAPAADLSRISLRNPRACFPATRRAELSTDAAFVAARQSAGLPLWEDEALRDVGPDSIAFLTSIQPRGLPRDWRVKLHYVRAELSTRDFSHYSLRPANYVTDRQGSGSLSHAWMLPSTAVDATRGKQTTLELIYSLTLLKPREYSVPTDGSHHALPGLGFCSATLDMPGNRIAVDCFTAFSDAAQFSAELEDIPASRMYGDPDFSPRWVKAAYGERTKLAIRSPRLSKHDRITVTAWIAAGMFDESIAVPGLLGDPETCPLPTVDGPRFQTSHWRDAAPHESRFVTVDAGVQLEVLDFGGLGSPVLLLPGLGATAHSFDELAPLLSRKHRVVAMTRRGTGQSSKPDFGFDTRRLGQDVIAVMDAMDLKKVALAGHSIAGDELTWLGGNHPDRFQALIYLDAAYDRSGDGDDSTGAGERLRELQRSLPPELPIPPAALLNYDAMTKLLRERDHVRLPEGELIAFHNVDKPFRAGSVNIDALTQQAIMAAIDSPPAYAAIGIPALAIYAFEDPSRQVNPTLLEIARLRNAIKRENIERFEREVREGEVLEMQNAEHYLIQSNTLEVQHAIEEFLTRVECDPCTSPATTRSPSTRD